MALGAPLALSAMNKAPKIVPMLKNFGILTKTPRSYIPHRPASSSVSSQLLKNKLIAKEISGGHAFEKHVLLQNEFPGYSRQRFENHIRNILNNPSEMKYVSNNRTGYWDNKSNTVIVRDPTHPDGGTAFKPVIGKKYYDDVLK